MTERIDADREAYLRDLKAEARLQMRPVCEYCGYHITDEHYYLIPIGGSNLSICENCLDDYMVLID